MRTLCEEEWFGEELVFLIPRELRLEAEAILICYTEFCFSSEKEKNGIMMACKMCVCLCIEREREEVLRFGCYGKVGGRHWCGSFGIWD